MKLILSLPSPSPSPSSPPFVQHNIFNVISRCRPVNRRTKDGAGESGRSLKEGARGGGGRPAPPPTPFCWETKLEGIRKYSFHGFKICISALNNFSIRFSRYDSWLFHRRNKTFRHDEMARARAHAWMKFTRPKVGTRGRMAEVGYSKSQPESKFDFRAARAIIGQQFFSSRISFSFPPPLPRFSSPPPPSPRLRCRGAARPEVAQTRQGSYLLEERVLRVTAGCSLFLDYCYAGGWRTGRREEDGEGGRRRKNGRVCVCVCVGEKKNKRAKETRWMWRWKREVPSENIENRAYHSAK